MLMPQLGITKQGKESYFHLMLRLQRAPASTISLNVIFQRGLRKLLEQHHTPFQMGKFEAREDTALVKVIQMVNSGASVGTGCQIPCFIPSSWSKGTW